MGRDDFRNGPEELDLTKLELAESYESSDEAGWTKCLFLFCCCLAEGTAVPSGIFLLCSKAYSLRLLISSQK